LFAEIKNLLVIGGIFLSGKIEVGVLTKKGLDIAFLRSPRGMEIYENNNINETWLINAGRKESNSNLLDSFSDVCDC
jgi:hypothetical protein